ncbi:LCP family protein [Actinoplanes sp. KI2]|uniref:LCP family protein n=1 Tax=Actinoplanes sp. KI2 TaxID=2983315 RepID=UPI0021D5CD8F|nr:LCP family protein [Actinoplanes sp. KI2]MCU7725278.1 LCP family protein [Actinoplanes sp. KI2]
MALAVLIGLAGAGFGTAVLYARHVEGEVGRDDILGRASALPRITAAPEYVIVNGGAAPATGGRNFLILGVDTRANWTQSQSRSDTIMLAHVDATRDHASIVSIPRDSYVYIPPVPGKWPGGKTKINAAYAWGGAPLVVQVVSHLTGVSIDHVVRVDFAAVRRITDIVGGVDVTVRKAVTDGRTGYRFHAGVNHLDGKLAEIYVRQRYGLAQGDFDRVKRQQQYLHALGDKVLSTGVVAHPLRLSSLLTEVAKAVVVDAGLDLSATARELSGLRTQDLDFATIPSTGFVRSAAGTANRLDPAGCRELFEALRTDTMAAYFRGHPGYRANAGA